ncbi:hypothetical protein OKW34_000033 [Paraburkholderia youngii]
MLDQTMRTLRTLPMPGGKASRRVFLFPVPLVIHDD